MTENEKLRALLAEARDGYVGHNLDCATVVCEECSLAARIDEALAEPVDDRGPFTVLIREEDFEVCK